MNYLKRISLSFICFAFAITISGCISKFVVSNIIPADNLLGITTIGKTLQINQVTGGGGAFPIVAVKSSQVRKTRDSMIKKIQSSEFEQALNNMFSKSKLFSQVVHSNGDFTLNAIIIDQDLHYPTISKISAVIFVNYTLLDNLSQKEIWKENILSKSRVMTTADAFSGFRRSYAAVEEAGKDNLIQLHNKLEQFFHKNVK